MTAAILTFHDADNYGAVLQAFALKKASEKYADVDIINYYNSFFHKEIKVSGIKSLAGKLNSIYIKQRKIGFEEFRTQYLAVKQPLIKKEQISSLNKQYDLFITGSDQVWNLECSGNDTTYFLDFVEGYKKNSYAASFGISQINRVEEIEKLLHGFDKISVREASGAEIIRAMLKRDVPVVLDPTFLLGKEEWKKYFNLVFGSEYVLVYEVLTGNQLFEQAKKFAQKRGLKVICVTATNKPRLGAKVIKNATPVEWLQLFAKAEYVFTNSFHGLAFSLIFNKQFFVEQLPPPAKTNTRIFDLLERLNLLNRNSMEAENLGEIDYTAVTREIAEKKLYSEKYLQSIFERYAEKGEKENEEKIGDYRKND